MEGFSRRNSLSLIGLKNQAKFDNDCISRNAHRIKLFIAQTNVIILVPFSSAEKSFTNYNTLARKVLKICRSTFWDTRYSLLNLHMIISEHFLTC